MQKYSNNVTTRGGAAVSGALVVVSTYPAGVAAPIYSDDGVTPKGNPITTDANGYFDFYAADGRYSLSITGNGISPYAVNDVILNDPADERADIADRLPEIANYASVRAYSGPQTAYYVRGVANIFDGGAGVFRVDSADTTSADNGGTILVDAAGRRWKRENSAAFNVAKFGVSGGADESEAIQAAVNEWGVVAVEGDGPFIASSLALNHVQVEGVSYPTLKSAAVGSPLAQMQDVVQVRGLTIDGDGSSSNRVAVGASGGANFVVENNIIANCPVNSFRAAFDAARISFRHNWASGSKLFNTDDNWTGLVVDLSHNAVLNIPGEGALIDQPATTPDATLVTHAANIYTSAAQVGTETIRAIGLARCVDVASVGNVYRGNTGTADLFHVEDKAENILSVGEVFDGNGATHIYDGALGGDPTYVHSDRDPKNILLASSLIKASGAAAVWLEGSSPNEFERVTVDGLHIDAPGRPMQLRLQDGVVQNNVVYDPPSPILIRKSDGAGSAYQSPTGHQVIVTRNNYIRPQFIRGEHGPCFDPNNIIARTSFAYADDTQAATKLTFGGSLGAGGTATYPVDAEGVKYKRITRGSVACTRRIDWTFNIADIDFQNLDTLSVQVMTRSSKRIAGKIQIEFPFAGPSLTAYALNDVESFGSWKVQGCTKVAPPTANFWAASAGTVVVRLYMGETLDTAGDWLDVAWVKISHVRGY